MIPFNSFGTLLDKSICVETDVQERSGIIYLTDEVKPFTGKDLCKHENSQVKFKEGIKNGKTNGKSTRWYENGQIKSEKNYKNGKCVSGDC